MFLNKCIKIGGNTCIIFPTLTTIFDVVLNNRTMPEMLEFIDDPVILQNILMAQTTTVYGLKPVSSLLQQRLDNMYLGSNDLVSIYQDSRKTIELQIKFLKTLVNKYLCKKKQTLICCIDFSQTFPSVSIYTKYTKCIRNILGEYFIHALQTFIFL